MILFYAWTDTQISNSINIKRNVYCKQKVDLLIYKLSRLSEEFIDSVKKADIFENVYILEMPDFCLERRRRGFSEKFEAVFLGGKYRRYFEQKLSGLIGRRKYSIFLTGAFWSESLLVIRYLKRYCKELAVKFYEEGLSAYNGPKYWLFQAVPNRSMKARLRTALYYGISSYTYRKYVDEIFLYKPELSNVNYLEKRQIPKKNAWNEFYARMQRIQDADDVYQQCDVIYIAEAPKQKSKQPMQSVYRVLDLVCSVKKEAKIVVKAHPVMQSLEICFDVQRYPNVYVDYRTDPIERILLEVEMDDKIVISENSTGVLYIKWVYGKNPYIILMRSERKKALEKYRRRFVESCGNRKAYVPKDEEELKRILSEILKKAGD